jgi:nucleotide-binding universal stress UspA family protein
MLIPLDGSKVAEQALPYARALAKTLMIPAELLEVVDPEALAVLDNPQQGRHLDALLAARTDSSKTYLELIAGSFEGIPVKWFVETGKAEEVVVEKAASDKDTLIVMATHGRSGIQRWLLGSVADMVLHGATNHVFLVRASDQGKTGGESAPKTVIVPLDGSRLAEKALPHVVDLAKGLKLKVVLMRAYALPPTVTADEYGTYTEDLVNQIEAEAKEYLVEKEKEVKAKGLENVVSVASFGYGAEKIITLAHETPDSFIAMCTHGRSGIKRWVLGSVTERVVRHSGDPVLIIRAA